MPHRHGFALLSGNAWGVLLGLLVDTWVSGASANNSVAELVQRAQWLQQRGQVAQAQELLQRAAKAQPGLEVLALARAEAYLADKNPFWALKVLGETVDSQPPACAARALAARIHLQQGNLEQAEHLLDAETCEHDPAMRLRFSLLRIELAELSGDARRVRQMVEASHSVRVRFIEDDRRYETVKSQYAPELQPALAFRLGLSSGWASHGLGSVPIDLAPRVSADGSPLLGLDLQTRFNLARWSWGRLIGNVDLLATQYLQAPTRELSSRQPSARIGTWLGTQGPRLYLGYAVDWVNLQGGGALAYDGFAHSEAHRLEYRIDLGRSFETYGSLGSRRFWEAPRTRIETVHGASKTLALSDFSNLVMGGAWYVHRAHASAYDQIGATVETALHLSLPRDFALSERLQVTRAVFPYSEGYFDSAQAAERRDTQVYGSAALTTPVVAGVRFELSYALAHRNSSLNSWNYTDHRAALALVWSSDSDRIRVRRIAPPGGVKMPYPDDTKKNDAAGSARAPEIIELIRSDETQRRNNSCAR